MIEAVIGGTLCIDCRLVMGEAALGRGRAIDHGDDAVHRDPGADLGPVEGADQGLGQGQARSLDDDVVRRGVTKLLIDLVSKCPGALHKVRTKVVGGIYAARCLDLKRP